MKLALLGFLFHASGRTDTEPRLRREQQRWKRIYTPCKSRRSLLPGVSLFLCGNAVGRGYTSCDVHLTIEYTDLTELLNFASVCCSPPTWYYVLLVTASTSAWYSPLNVTTVLLSKNNILNWCTWSKHLIWLRQPNNHVMLLTSSTVHIPSNHNLVNLHQAPTHHTSSPNTTQHPLQHFLDFELLPSLPKFLYHDSEPRIYMINFWSHVHGRSLQTSMSRIGTPTYDHFHMVPPNIALDMKRLDFSALVCDVFN
jgi:hypothetical protein